MNRFELERWTSRTEVAEYLRELADGLEGGDKITLVVGEESTTMHPPEEVHMRVETDSDNSWLGGEEGQSLRLELGWEATEVENDGELEIIQQSNRRDRAARSDTTSTSVDE